MKIFILFSLFFYSCQVFANEKIELSAVTQKTGIEGYKKARGSIDDPTVRSGHKVYGFEKVRYKKVGLDVNDHFHKKMVAAQKDKNFYFVFWNTARAKECKRGFLIQRVMRRKIFYQGSTVAIDKSRYLVEIFKLDKDHRIKGYDQHFQDHALGQYTKREMKVEIEIGCGELPGKAEGYSWPASPYKKYVKLQNYNESKGLFDKVKFDFSRSYQFSTTFSRHEPFTYILPDFMKGL